MYHPLKKTDKEEIKQFATKWFQIRHDDEAMHQFEKELEAWREQYAAGKVREARLHEVGAVQMVYGKDDKPVMTQAGGRFQTVEQRYDELEATLNQAKKEGE